MHDKLADIDARFEEVSSMMVDPTIIQNRDLYLKLTREHAGLEPIVEAWRRLNSVDEQLAENREMLSDDDPDIRDLAKEEIAQLERQRESVNGAIRLLLLPKDPLDVKDIILEIRAGTGGDEAGLFASDLFRMYSRFAENRRWKVDILSSNESQLGGFKEVIASVSGKTVYSVLKYESGVHRVQRVPQTESQGRIHTSTVTVAVLPEADEVDVKIEDKDLRIDVFRSSGPGGQSVNTTDSAVRVTHVPTGLIVICQDEKSQHKNKAKALKVLRSRLLEAETQKQQDSIAKSRRAQVGTGERSERIRTYNYPEGRVTDHRIGLTVHRLENILQGDIDLLIIPLREHHQAEALKGDS